MDRADAGLAGHLAHVKSRRAAEGQQGEVPGIPAAPHGQQPDAFGHGRGYDVQHAVCGFLNGKVQGFRHVCYQRLVRPFRMQPGPPAQEIPRIEVPQDQVRVGHRGPVASLPVTGRARIGPGALGSDVQGASVIHPGNAAAARSQRMEIDHRHGDFPSPFVVFPRNLRIAAFDYRNVRARPAHIESDEIGLADQPAVGHGAAYAAGGTREYSLHGLPCRGVQRCDAAVGRHGEYLVPQPQFRSLLLHAPEVPGVDRSHVGVDGRRAQPVVFLDLRQDPGGERQVKAGIALLDAFAHEPLMGRVHVGENETHGHGFHAGLYEDVQNLVQRFAIHGRFDGAVGADTLRERAAQRPGNQRFHGRHPEIVPIFF